MPIDNINLIEKILYTVEKPGRYVGGEHNQILKDWGSVDVRWCLIFPDIYDIGQANLGLAMLYQILNARETILAERSFAPWVDMEAEMRRHQIPCFRLKANEACGNLIFLVSRCRMNPFTRMS